MKIRSVAALIVLTSAVIIQGCTTHLSHGQTRELSAYKEKNLAVQEKSVGTAAILGLFPAMGYLYTGHYVLAVTTIPLYPFLGPLWMPFDSAAAAKNRNYYATKEHVSRERAKEFRLLDQKLEDKEINYEQHIREQRIIEAKYEPY